MTQEQAYESVRLLIYRICHQHRARRGGCFDELVSEANLAFLSAYRRYEPNPDVTLAQWIAFVVRHELLEGARNHASRKRDVKSLPAAVPDKRSRFTREALFEALREDGRSLVALVLDPPLDVEVSAMVGQGYGTDEVHNLRGAVREYLEDWGWGPERIADAFGEVRLALAE